ncbi:energy transducer TonB [Hyphomonas johnsonii]|uniref:TonB C-terminal domain-containing protein n=1 Tax=Hyphomonas johnsonii MHS-2 TaxID=1280950 RepID=A0A059FJP4_9PROT|nr:energy transducer TonB [Hyphomonas johnsonii]KCZ90756.1 hypothetical protein HJO_12931 [Hyphomonas johnsonii MHS-2]
MPDAVIREHFSGCCRTGYTVDTDGRARDITVECTSPVFSSAAIDAIASATFKPARILGLPIRTTGQSHMVTFEMPGETGICAEGNHAWNNLIALGEEAFPFLTMDTGTMAPYATDALRAVGVARGWAAYYTTLDFETPCGPHPGYVPSIQDSEQIETMDWDALRQTGAAFEKVFAWMNCRDDMLKAYAEQAVAWHAEYDSAPANRIEHWTGSEMDRLIAGERSRYRHDLKFMKIYAGQIVRREQVLQDQGSADPGSPSEREVVPTYREPGLTEHEWTAADQFFYEQGPGPHQACLDNASTYGAKQACLGTWWGSK